MATILVVDDEKDMLAVLSNLFEKNGLSVLTAASGNNAVEAVKNNKIDIVFLDIHLPDIDGLDVLKQIMAVDKQIPVIMCSGLDDEDLNESSLRIGAIDYVEKPFDNDKVIEKVRQILKKRNIEIKPPAPAAKAPKKMPKNFWAYALGCAILVLAIAVIFTKIMLVKKEKFVIYRIPYMNPTSLACETKGKSQYLWISDWLEQSIWKHNMDKTLSVIQVFHLAKNYPNGIAAGNGVLWSSDSSTHRIYKHNMDESLTVSAAFTSPGSNPSGLCWDGTFLWSCDSDRKKIFKHRLDSDLSVVSAYNSPGPSPAGISWDGKNIWSCDADTNKIYKHNMDNFLSVAKEYQPLPFASGKNRITGLAWDGKYLWFALEGTGQICRYHKSLLK